MDLYATLLDQDKAVHNYIVKHYGAIPRLRGVRFMRYEEPEVCNLPDAQGDMWLKYCGKDVIYIHTRCGASNYEDFGADQWEQSHSDTFLESVNDGGDCTYRDHYFTAVLDEDYNKICQRIEEGVLG